MDASAEHMGGLDVLVNNAGISSAGTVIEVDEAHWERVLPVNLTASYLCSRYAVPHMEPSGGGSIAERTGRNATSASGEWMGRCSWSRIPNGTAGPD